ncbi:MAG: transcription-repair coupling factor [Thermomicrobiales bacterium]|nr:transcription-repair coupling factor [Thermomicrobiales bacterium]
MKLAHLLPVLQQAPSLARLTEQIEANESAQLLDLPSAAKPAIYAALASATDRTVLILSSKEDRSLDLAAAMRDFLPDPVISRHWPAPEGVPWDRMPRDHDLSSQRVAILAALAGATSPKPRIVTTSIAGLTHFVIRPKLLAERTLQITHGRRLGERQIMEWATSAGYEPEPLVTASGQVARRGGIIDIFGPGSRDPLRIELFGDEIDSIRKFNASNQRSFERVEDAVLLPATEFNVWELQAAVDAVQQLDLTSLRDEVRTEFEGTLARAAAGSLPHSLELFAPSLDGTDATLLTHLDRDALIVIDDPDAVELAARQRQSHAAEALGAAVQSGELPAGLAPAMASWRSVKQSLRTRQTIFGGPSAWGSESVALSFDSFKSAPVFAGRLSDLHAAIGAALGDGWRVTVGSDQAERITHSLEDAGILPRRLTRSSGPVVELPAGSTEVLQTDLDGGWLEESTRTLLLSDMEIFGFRKRVRRGPERSRERWTADQPTLNPGEYVVHIDHGVARFTGLTRVEISGVEREYLLLEFAKGDKLYVPVDQSHRVNRYSAGGLSPELNRLGSGEWTRTRQRVRKAVREMAFELLNLYASRETVTGYQFAADTQWDLDLAESFPYTETPDQLKAVVSVRDDMESWRPMDRLICGDVGFGKTEVAIRAAFKAVNAGKQVAVLVPTTVLALQHLTTFSQRLAGFPVKVEMLSRLRSPKEQREILAGLKDGSIDIIIGTHRLVQPDVQFSDLGLAVIDEEQRFGVRQKEFLKQLRTEVDVITMSATPIPRTLHTALAGIRDISIIDTPPQARLPIRTFVTASDDALIREVVLREIDRGGQIFVVHNRVASIGRLAAHLQQLIPEARIGIGHGQMEEDVLEQIMIDFINERFDVLVCTTIIESGVDIPNANTIIIDNSDTLGLTQLYQLRGRVGRGANRAYAYLLVKPGKPLTVEAEARLEAIQEATELGAGLKLAMRDMEIRGAGNILGAEQSGHIAEVGYELYLRLLSQAVEEIKAGHPISDPTPVTLDLPLTALIPAGYIQDVELRLNTYRGISALTSHRQINAMRDELTDRFGEPPEEVERLFSLISLRIRCEELGIESVVEREREIVVRPVDTSHLERQKIHALLGPAVKFTPQSIRIRLPDLEIPWSQALDSVMDAIEAHRDAITRLPISA